MTMQVQTVSYMKRKNMGNYEHEEVSLTAIVEEGENFMDAIAQVKFACQQALQMVVKVENNEPKQEEANDEPPKKAKVAKKVTKKKPVKEKVEQPEPEVEEPTEESPEENYTLQDVKQILAQVWKSKGEGIAKEILKKFGVARSNELSEDQYAAVIEKAKVCLK